MKDRNDARIHLFEKHKGKSPYQRFCIAEMYLQQAIARIKFKEFFGAAYEVRKAYKTLEENNREYPDFKPNLRGLGLIHAAVGSIPKNYQWLAGMLGLGGTIKQGLNELKILLNTTYKEKEYYHLQRRNNHTRHLPGVKSRQGKRSFHDAKAIFWCERS
jgi:hypothetical protein